MLRTIHPPNCKFLGRNRCIQNKTKQNYNSKAESGAVLHRPALKDTTCFCLPLSNFPSLCCKNLHFSVIYFVFLAFTFLLCFIGLAVSLYYRLEWKRSVLSQSYNEINSCTPNFHFRGIWGHWGMTVGQVLWYEYRAQEKHSQVLTFSVFNKSNIWEKSMNF